MFWQSWLVVRATYEFLRPPECIPTQLLSGRPSLIFLNTKMGAAFYVMIIQEDGFIFVASDVKFESVNHWSKIDVGGLLCTSGKVIPMSKVCFRYLKTALIAFKWLSVGLGMAAPNFPAAKDYSALVRSGKYSRPSSYSRNVSCCCHDGFYPECGGDTVTLL